MKRFEYGKIAVTVLAAAAILLLLSACSGVIGGDIVRISFSSGSGGRYISTDANSGYVVVLQKDKVYSLNSFEDKAYQEFEDGNVYITNLPAGDYIFGIVLIDDQDTEPTDDDVNVGLAIKEVEIKKGFNDVIIDVGPGITTFEINTVSYEDFFTPDGYSVTFAEDTIILDIDRTASDEVHLVPNLGSATGVMIPSGGASLPSPWDVTGEDGVAITIAPGVDPLPHDYFLNIILE